MLASNHRWANTGCWCRTSIRVWTTVVHAPTYTRGVGDTGSFDRKSLTMRAVRRICRLREGTDPSPSDAASRRGRCSGVRETDRVCNAGQSCVSGRCRGLGQWVRWIARSILRASRAVRKRSPGMNPGPPCCLPSNSRKRRRSLKELVVGDSGIGGALSWNGVTSRRLPMPMRVDCRCAPSWAVQGLACASGRRRMGGGLSSLRHDTGAQTCCYAVGTRR